MGTKTQHPGGLYPEIEPYNTGFLKVSDIHEIYYEQCGKPNGKPIIYLYVAGYKKTFLLTTNYFSWYVSKLNFRNLLNALHRDNVLQTWRTWRRFFARG